MRKLHVLMSGAPPSYTVLPRRQVHYHGNAQKGGGKVMERLLVVSSSPHIHSPLSTQKIMMWVLIALAPAGLAGAYFFGLRAAAVMAVCVAFSVLSEKIWQKCAHQPEQ